MCDQSEISKYIYVVPGPLRTPLLQYYWFQVNFGLKSSQAQVCLLFKNR